MNALNRFGVALLWASGALAFAGVFHLPAPWDVSLVLTFAVVGYLVERSSQREREAVRVMREAAQQERQARLIADAIAERQTRQQLGEFNDQFQ